MQRAPVLSDIHWPLSPVDRAGFPRL